MAGSYLTNGVYLPEISESPWGEQVNNNFVILSDGIDNVKNDYNTKLSGKFDRTSTTTQSINSNANVNGEWNFANTVQGTITYAIHSNDADHAILADTATNANHASSADTAHTSDTSAYATSAYSSNYSERCNQATKADSATKAKCDNDGNDISQTYLKISNYDTQTAITALNALREHIADEEAHTSLQQQNDIQSSFTSVNNRIDAVNDDLTAHKNNTDIHTSRQEKIDIQNNFNNLQSSLDTHANDTDLHMVNGNARTADEFKENKTIELEGDVTGTASSKGNWTISTTLANSGVVSGTYGQSSDISNQKTYQIVVPLITVDSKGRITNITTKTVTTTIPTKVSELSNDLGYLTTHQSKSDLGLGNVSNYDQSKAIKSITRSGLTFTYTCLDGSTGTFTQQDDNTTYSAGTGLTLNNNTFSVTSTAGNSELQWNSEITLGTVGGLAIKAKLPQNPNTDTTYSAGTGLSLNNNTFSVTSTAGNSNLQWNSEVTLGTVGGLAIKAKLPANPNTDTTYSAGTNMNLSGTTMNLNDSITVNSVNTGSLVINGWTISIG